MFAVCANTPSATHSTQETMDERPVHELTRNAMLEVFSGGNAAINREDPRTKSESNSMPDRKHASSGFVCLHCIELDSRSFHAL